MFSAFSNFSGLGAVSRRTLAQRIRQLFAAGEQGVVYDPSDLSTLFQGAAGTTPVTAVDQPVGLVLDESKGLVLGATLVTNGGFDSGASWVNGTWAISGGSATTSEGGNLAIIYQSGIVTIGKWYCVSFDLVSLVGGSGVAVYTGTTRTIAASSFIATTTGRKTGYIFASDSAICFRAGLGTTTATIDNISVKELPGNHGKQATSTARPLYKAGPSRIDYDAVDDALVTTFAASLGANCTVARAVPGVGASILTGQTIGTSYTDTTDHAGLIIVNRALTASETASVTAYLNAKAFA